MRAPTITLGAGGVLAAVGLAAAGLVAWRVWRTGATVASAAAQLVARDLNPASTDNLVNRGVTAAGRAVSGDSAWTLGGWLYDLTHDDPMDTINRPLPPIDFGHGNGWDDTPSRSVNDLARAEGAGSYFNP